MAEIVYNAKFGGFSVSEEAMHRYAELKGLTLSPEPSEFGDLVSPTYWLVPEDQRSGIIPTDEWWEHSLEDRQRSNALHQELTLNDREFDREDPVLVQVVKELGERANGRFAQLEIANVPDGTLYRIDEYDGNETVMTQDDYEWRVAGQHVKEPTE